MNHSIEFATEREVTHRGVTHRVVDHTARRIINRCAGEITLRKVSAHVERERRQGTLGYSHFIDLRQTQCLLAWDDLHRLHWLLSVLSVTDGLGVVTLVVSDDATFEMFSRFAQWTVSSPKIEVWKMETDTPPHKLATAAPERYPSALFKVVRR